MTIANWILEECVTVGSGPLVLSGPVTSFGSFNNIPAGSVWYSIEDGNNREAGYGTFDGTNTITRTRVDVTLVGNKYNDTNPVPIQLSGNARVACTLNAESYKETLAELASLDSRLTTAEGTLSTHVSDLTNPHDTSWDNLLNKPTEFNPTPHSHELGQITDFPSGGLENYYLVKATDSDYDVEWFLGPVVSSDTEPTSPDLNLIWRNTITDDVSMWNGSAWISIGGGNVFASEQQTATAGQTVFTLVDLTYHVDTGSISIYINGIRQYPTAYTETDSSTITFSEGLNDGDEVYFVVGENEIGVSTDNFIRKDPTSTQTINGQDLVLTNGDFTCGTFTSTGIDDNATSTAITINNNEYVLVGKAASNTTTVGCEFLPNGIGAFTANNVETLFLNRLTSDGAIIGFRKDGTTVGSIRSYGGVELAIGGTGNSGIHFGANKIQAMNMTTGVRQDGTVDVGSSGYRFKDLYLSGGAYLGGTAQANALDDYEEGTWTPSISAIGGGAAITGAVTSNGTYTKIGEIVNARCDFVFGTSITWTALNSYFQMAGLPFPSVNDFNSFAVGTGNVASTGAKGVGRTIGSTATAYIWGFEKAAGTVTQISCSIVYQTI